MTTSKVLTETGPVNQCPNWNKTAAIRACGNYQVILQKNNNKETNKTLHKINKMNNQNKMKVNDL